MKRKFVWLVLAVLLLLPVQAMATVAIEHGLGFLHITLDGTGDFEWATATITAGNNSGSLVSALYPRGLQITAMSATAATAAATKVVARNLTTAGTIIPMKMSSSTGDTMVDYKTGKRWYKPCLKHSDQTNDTSLEVWFEYDN